MSLIPKTQLLSERGILMIDFRQFSNFQRRTFNLKNQQTNNLNRTNSILSALGGGGDLSTKSDPSQPLYTLQSKKIQESNITTEFVKIGMDYEAI